MRRLRTVVLSISLTALFFAPFAVFAQDADTPTSDIANIEEVNSFELFWPVVAGKTTGEPLYFLKSLKEKVRGWFIFGASQKAEYAVFLATKRVVEAEKLINEGKNDLADKTLSRATTQLEKAEQNLGKALDKGTPFQDEAVNIENRLSNLEIFVPWLILNSEENKEALSRFLEKVESLSSKLS